MGQQVPGRPTMRHVENQMSTMGYQNHQKGQHPQTIPQAMPAEPEDTIPEKHVLEEEALHSLLNKDDPIYDGLELDPSAEQFLLLIADEFVESVLKAGTKLAKHRSSNVLEEKDIRLHLERYWNIRVPGYGSTGIRKKQRPPSQAHKQRMNAINKIKKKR
eukprot:TRINITY_DN1379_c0_g1_i1.p1 TRINITY_DN1379_c0_g1~~TRINITY_DN1379_c0_g1_i1.p1  ORF type:complete len:160 (-),score=36.68 TRINITY_DN1379_c0_g1_i1:110-589(-)